MTDTHIDWLRSTTRRTTEHTRRSGDRPHEAVTHEAVFAVEPGAIADLPHEHSHAKLAVAMFSPEFFAATWRDGILTDVRITGSNRLRSGGTGRTTRYQTYRAQTTAGIDHATLPAEVAAAIVEYSTAVATESAARAGWLRK